MSDSKKMTFLQGVSISIGSIIGSGVLFLPSLTVLNAGTDALLGWLLIILLIVPGLYFFKDLFQISGKNGIADFVELGFGSEIAKSIPLILLATVIFGMPSACIVASEYLKAIINNASITKLIPFAIIAVSSSLVLNGIKTSAVVNSLISVLLVLTGFLICCYSTLHIESIAVPVFNYDLKNVLQVSVLAFWAFAGFENLTFLSDEFENPKHLIPSILIALTVCGLIYLLLTYDILMLIPVNEINASSGLMQLASLNPSASIRVLVAVFAFCCVLVNMISWTAGISKAIVSSAEKGLLPKILVQTKNEVPRNAIIFLTSLFYVSLAFSYISENVFKSVLTLVSSNFLFVYFLVMASYLKTTKVKYKKIISFIVCLLLLMALISYGFFILYPLSILVFAAMRKI